MLTHFLLALAMIAFPAPTQQPTGVLGYWREPGGSVIEIFKCGQDVCAKLAAIRKNAPSLFDINDPDEAARKRPLCGLQIGYGFHIADPAHADGGRLYDPKSGRTYHGVMTAEADQLHLRGYVGFKMFGRTETWTRTDATATTCTANH